MWEGSATELLSAIDDAVGGQALKGVTARSLGRSMSYFASKNLPWLEKKSRRYVIKELDAEESA